jgi:uncharacterized membrane protein YbhN (UPF0104 family)
MNWVNALVKLGVSIAIGVGFAVWSASSLKGTQEGLNWNVHFALAFVFCLASNLIGVIRWWGLTRSQGLPLGLKLAALLSLSGDLFNVVLPLGIAGDLVKSSLGSRLTQTPLNPWLRAWTADRFCGILGLLFVAVALCGSSVQARWLAPFLSLLFLGAVSVAFFFARFRGTPQIRSPALDAVWQSVRFAAYVPLKFLVGGVVLASASHLATLFALVELSRGLGLSAPLLPLLRASCLGLLASSIPFLPGGLGTGNAAFEAAFHALGEGGGGLVYSLYALHFVFVGALGLASCAFLLRKNRFDWTSLFEKPTQQEG